MDKDAIHATHFRVRAPILQEDEGGDGYIGHGEYGVLRAYNNTS